MLGSASAFAQKGDRAGESQSERIPAARIPPAPALTPAEALQTFKVAPGFSVELVAAEPLVRDPVAIVFDPQGRIWVVEMRGFMPDVDGHGEEDPVGDIAILEDTDGDGRMDKRTLFLEGLVLPRAVALLRSGALVAEPPRLWFCPDANGDAKSDDQIELAADYGRVGNPEHTANGLLLALDNWIYSANHTFRYRWAANGWNKELTVFRGQWGISQDNYGRLFYNSNSDHLRGDVVPAHYLMRNPHYPKPAGANVQLVKTQEVWPIRMNPGVNRGYQPAQLRADGTLATFAAACAPWIYRGDNFPAEFAGNAFVCEPAGNLVHRDVIVETNGTLAAYHPYRQGEFLASTDERFRPVNLATGPDGALYVVDMYRGILQHRLYVTTYLRKQIEARGLAEPIGLGRIYRVVHAQNAARALPKHHTPATPAEWVPLLAHPNAWWRDTAQRLLVERRDAASIAPLETMVASHSNRLARLHALWTLAGLDRLTWPLLARVHQDADSKIRAAAIRLSEPFLKSAVAAEGEHALGALTAALSDRSPDVRLQLALTLGESDRPAALAAMIEIAKTSAGHLFVRDALITGLYRRELEFLERTLHEIDSEKSAELISALARCVFTQGTTERISRLLALAAGRPGRRVWQQRAILSGILATVPVASRGRPALPAKIVRLPSEPDALARLRRANDRSIRPLVRRVDDLLMWPGKPGYENLPKVQALTEEQKNLFETGKELYATTCGGCHQPTGLGQDGLAPPLADSEWVVGSEGRLIRIVLHGVRGPLEVKGSRYNLDMPPLGILDDAQLAALLTYIRREWGHTASPVDSQTIARVREQHAERVDAWTEPELLKVP